jgi:hypothetical protein
MQSTGGGSVLDVRIQWRTADGQVKLLASQLGFVERIRIKRVLEYSKGARSTLSSCCFGPVHLGNDQY